MTNSFKFGKPYRNRLIYVNLDTDLLEHNIVRSQVMFQRLSEQRARDREEAIQRQQESIERGMRVHWEAQARLLKEQEEYKDRQRESIQRYVEERDEETRRRFEELKRYRYGF